MSPVLSDLFPAPGLVTQLAFPFDFLVSVSCLGRGWSSFSFQPRILLSAPPSLFLFFSDASLPFNQTALSCLAWVPTLETTETTENRPVPAVLTGEIWLECTQSVRDLGRI